MLETSAKTDIVEAPLKAALSAALLAASPWGLLIAIAALGLGTSPGPILATGWRHLALFAGTTALLLAVVLGGPLAIG